MVLCTEHLTRQQWQRWSSQGLFHLFPPIFQNEPDWSNGISSRHEIAGRMFEDEYDLALAIMDGMEARSVKGGYTLERFKFNSA